MQKRMYELSKEYSNEYLALEGLRKEIAHDRKIETIKKEKAQVDKLWDIIARIRKLIS